MRLLPPVRFRFCEDDRERYGSDWTVYDESALVRVPAGELAEMERQIGMSIPTMLARSRAGYTDATRASTWVARRLDGISEPYEAYEPLVLLMEWEAVPAAADVDPPDPTSSPETAPEG